MDLFLSFSFSFVILIRALRSKREPAHIVESSGKLARTCGKEVENLHTQKEGGIPRVRTFNIWVRSVALYHLGKKLFSQNGPVNYGFQLRFSTEFKNKSGSDRDYMNVNPTAEPTHPCHCHP